MTTTKTIHLSDEATAQLNAIADGIREELEVKNAVRDKAVTYSRELIRYCAECIRAIHRQNWREADDKLQKVAEGAATMREMVKDQPDLYHTGYTQDALKEVAEAYITYAIIKDEALPTPQALNIESATYLKGMSEAATELRRFILDIMRRQERHSDEAERLLAWMDTIYDHLITFDFPDAITYGLRRQTDVVRNVLERTRGDLTHSLRQQRLQDALALFERRLGMEGDTSIGVLLSELHAAILAEKVAAQSPDDTEALDEETLATMQALEEQLERVLDENTPDEPRSLVGQLERAVERFEVQNPALTMRLQAVINALANAGL